MASPTATKLRAMEQVRAAPRRWTMRPATGRPTIEPAEAKSSTTPNWPALRSSRALASGIRLAQLANEIPEAVKTT